MAGSERNRIDRAIDKKQGGDRAGNGLYWDPHTKRLYSGRDPDSARIYATQSDLGHG